MFRVLIFIFYIMFSQWIYAKSNLQPAITEVVPLSELQGYKNYQSSEKKLIEQAYLLSEKNITYLYGSADPKRGGMDCSGTIYYLLKKLNILDVPRQSDEIFYWTKQKGNFHYVNVKEFSSNAFSQLKPGDLLFWSGTYSVHRQSGITHVMFYLGKNHKGQPLMFGASDGRTYQGRKMWGVSVFDFKLSKKESRAKFVGYSCIPNLTC